VTCVGSALQAGASGHSPYAMMIVGRILCGIGLAIVSTSVPLYQRYTPAEICLSNTNILYSEVAPARQRGKYVVMNHIGLVAGLAVAFWVGYGVSFWKTPHGLSIGWRFSISLQYIPAVFFMAVLPLVPETYVSHNGERYRSANRNRPRWLVEKNQIDRARKSLYYVREGSFSEAEIEAELEHIISTVEAEKAIGTPWTALFTRPNLFQRLWRAALLQFMAQMCGATAIKYYLPGLFQTLSLGHQLSLMISGIESTLKIGCTIIEMFIIDRFGRRVTIMAGCAVMAVSMLVSFSENCYHPSHITNLNRLMAPYHKSILTIRTTHRIIHA
jgi:MFS family permease